MLNNNFEGYYFKHQKGPNTVAFIPGMANDTAFIQVITNEKTYNYKYQVINFNKIITIGKCEFSLNEITIDMDGIQGKIAYSNLTPIKYDIMGPFKFFPMECRHKVLSMHHNINGYIMVEGQYFDFTNGIGYIEKDSGRSFPKNYLWIQSNDFSEKCSIMVSIANIPFMGLHFEGCICAIIYHNKEYRFATYLGVKILCRNEDKIILSQGSYKLEITIDSKVSHDLYAPKNGFMSNIIRESNDSHANFKLSKNHIPIFDINSNNVSFEYNYNDL